MLWVIDVYGKIHTFGSILLGVKKQESVSRFFV